MKNERVLLVILYVAVGLMILMDSITLWRISVAWERSDRAMLVCSAGPEMEFLKGRQYELDRVLAEINDGTDAGHPDGKQ